MNKEIILSIQEIPSNDCRFLRLADNSVYNSEIDVENAILEITPPGYACAVFYGLEKGFNSMFNSGSLRINVAKKPKDLVIIPDGVYKIKFSVKPNTQLFVEYDMLRTCQLQKSLAQSIGNLFRERASLLKRDFDSKLDQLTWIKQLAEASKYMVDELEDSNEGVNLYNESVRLLTIFKEKGC